MCKLVDYSEDLRRLGIGSVDEDQWCHRIGKGKPAELLGVEHAVSVRADDAVNHDQDAISFNAVNESTPRVLPVREGAPLG